MILVYEVLHNYIVFNFIQAKLSCFVVVVVVGGGGGCGGGGGGQCPK